MTDNRSEATHFSGNIWKASDDTMFSTPSNEAPGYGTSIAIHKGNGDTMPGKFINGEAIKDS